MTGTIAGLLAMLLPALARSRDVARLAQCASNLHQIVTAMNAYAAQFHGRYPQNTSSTSPAVNWYDDDQIGAYLPARRPPVPTNEPGGGIYICPNDGPDLAFLSYAMNAWASPKADPALTVQIPTSGRLWPANVKNSPKMILLAEAYSYMSVLGTNRVSTYYAPAMIGSAYASSGAPSYTPMPTTAGQRFGGAGGILLNAKRFGSVLSELPFYRHRTAGGPQLRNQPIGRVNIAYADGHVASKTNADLVRPDGQTTGDSCWSPADLSGN